MSTSQRAVTSTGLDSELDHAALTYQHMASLYEAFTADDNYDRWVDLIEELAAAAGVRGGDAFDVATGTGKVAARLVGRGWNVTASDLSSEMLSIAARNPLLQGVDLHEADMRCLPNVGTFDLITCIDDAVNYLLSIDDLVKSLNQMKCALKTGGVVVFDVNTIHTYRTFYASTTTVVNPNDFMVWIGHNAPTFRTGEIARANLEIFSKQRFSWTRTTLKHTQRHYSETDVAKAIKDAGLEFVSVSALGTTGYLEPLNSPETQHKHIFVARNSSTQ